MTEAYTLESGEVYEVIHFLIIGIENQVKSQKRLIEDLKGRGDDTWAWQEQIGRGKSRLSDGLNALTRIIERGEGTNHIFLREWVHDKVRQLKIDVESLR